MTSFSRRDLRRAAAIAGLVAAITGLHYGTDPTYLHLHVLYRELYFVPILLAALRFGKWGGLGTALVTTALYAPHIAMSVRTPESTVGNVLEIVFFCVFGGIVGSYVDIRRGYEKAMTRAGPGPTDRIGRRVLVCLDGSAGSQSAASYAGDVFGSDPEASVTLLWLPPDVVAGFSRTVRRWARRRRAPRARRTTRSSVRQRRFKSAALARGELVPRSPPAEANAHPTSFSAHSAKGTTMSSSKVCWHGRSARTSRLSASWIARLAACVPIGITSSRRSSISPTTRGTPGPGAGGSASVRDAPASTRSS